MQTFTALEYLQIDVANNFGLDKKRYEERLQWTKEHEDELENLVSEAKAPAMYLAAITAYRKACNGEVNYYPISLDATSSGTQLQACALGDEATAKMCNVVDTDDGTCADYYTLIYNQLKDKFHGDYDREEVKQALMTWGYSSNQVPAEIFSEEDLEIFLSGIEELSPAVSSIRNLALDAWNPDIDKYEWVMPDLFHAHFDVVNTQAINFDFYGVRYEVNKTIKAPKKNGRSLGPNLIHSIDALIVREIQRKCMFKPQQLEYVKRVLTSKTTNDVHELTYERMMCAELWNQYKLTGFLSARIMDFITYDTKDIVEPNVILEFIETYPAKPFKVISIHDAFRCLPNYGNDLRQQYNICLAQVAKGNLYEKIFNEAVKKKVVTITKDNPDMWERVLNANYSLC